MNVVDHAFLAQKGSYALLFRQNSPMIVQQIGRLGGFEFPAGRYIYLGSAHGSGGLAARLRHHQRIHTAPHWHLDWLRPALDLEGGWVSTSPRPLECLWSQALLALPGAYAPAAGFGAADCHLGCPTHLVALAPDAPVQPIAAMLKQALLPAEETLLWLPAPLGDVESTK